LPLIDINLSALMPPKRGETLRPFRPTSTQPRSPAADRTIGDDARGILAIGGIARGFIAMGGRPSGG
jgi:hypothetical protein